MVSNSFTSQPQFGKYTRSDHPLTYILNWNGSFFDGLLCTRWSVGAQTMTQGRFSYIATLGQKLSFRRFQVYVDYMGSWDSLDRLGIVRNDLGLQENVRYHSVIGKASWQFAPKWNLMGKGMYELASVAQMPQLALYRQSIGWVGSVEFYPWDQQDLRFFLAYIGRNYDFTKASGIAVRNGTEHRIELGFMFRIKAY